MPDDLDLIGTVVDGRYRILRRLGAGGMGEVYLGEHLRHNRHEALKILKRRFARDAGHLARFRREARATNRLQHPNIVSFYDFGKLADGRLYLSMEFADGPDLKQCLEEEGRFDPERVVRVMRQLALAIDYAHSMGVIHRDLKPQNLVLVKEEARPELLKILDFGVAKITAAGYNERFAITREGEIFGTPAYISPEQIKGVSDDSRIDIYALGCIAYELLTGESPFQGRPMSVLQAHISDIPVSPSSRCLEARIPPELDEIVLKCLEKNPDDRYQSCAALAEALSEVHFEADAGLSSRGMSQGALLGFETEATVEGIPDAMTNEGDLGFTTDVYAIHGSVVLRDLLRKLVEAMCDLGCSDPMLLVRLAEVNDVEEEVSLIRQDLVELVRREELLIQQTRERVASLRFALGELRAGQLDDQVENSQDKDISETDAETVAKAVANLETKLFDCEVRTDEQLLNITEQQITQTAERAHKFEELNGLDHRLSELVEKHSGQFSRNERVSELLGHRQRVLARISLEDDVT